MKNALRFQISSIVIFASFILLRLNKPTNVSESLALLSRGGGGEAFFLALPKSSGIEESYFFFFRIPHYSSLESDDRNIIFYLSLIKKSYEVKIFPTE